MSWEQYLIILVSFSVSNIVGALISDYFLMRPHKRLTNALEKLGRVVNDQARQIENQARRIRDLENFHDRIVRSNLELPD